MSDLISRSALDSFFYSETSGTDEIIEDAVMKYSEMEMEFSDDCRALCKDIIEMCRNVIRTEPIVEAIQKEKLDEIVEKLESKKKNICGSYNWETPVLERPSCKVAFNNGICEAIEIVKGVMNERD